MHGVDVGSIDLNWFFWVPFLFFYWIAKGISEIHIKGRRPRPWF